MLFVRLAPSPSVTPKRLNTLGDHLRARRINLGLFQSQVAAIIGVVTSSIFHWESNATQPEVHYVPAIIRFLGYNPFPAATEIPERIARARQLAGMNQKQFAAALGVDPTTVRDWENGQHTPTRKKLDAVARILPAY